MQTCPGAHFLNREDCFARECIRYVSNPPNPHVREWTLAGQVTEKNVAAIFAVISYLERYDSKGYIYYLLVVNI